MSTVDHDGTDPHRASHRANLLLRRYGPRGFVLLALLHLSVLWVDSYPTGDLDDKAVHYYSAARLYADGDHAGAVAKARSAWLTRLDVPEHFRLENRLDSFANYPIPSSLLRLVLQVEQPRSHGPPSSITTSLKVAFLLLHLSGLMWLVIVTWRNPLVSVFLFVCLAIAALRLSFPWITDDPRRDMLYLVYVPRGSAILLLVSVFAAYQQRRYVLAAITCVLLVGWHAGLAAIVVPMALLSIGLTRAVEICSGWTRRILVGLLFLSGSGAMAATGSVCLLARLWIPLLLFGLILITGKAPSQSPWLCAVSLTSTYLLVSQTLIMLLANHRVLAWFGTATGNMLVAELPLRLSGSRQVASIALLLALALGFVNVMHSLWLRGAPKGAALMAATFLFFVAVLNVQRGAVARVVCGRSPFFRTEHVVRRPVTAEVLEALDPGDESVFFASLGDFILYPSAIDHRH